MKYILLSSLLIVSIASPAFAQTKRIKAVEHLKRHHRAILMTPVLVSPPNLNENWDQLLNKAKDQNSGG
jgi:predicted S18 family serine protease